MRPSRIPEGRQPVSRETRAMERRRAEAAPSIGRVAEAQAIWKEELASHPPKHDDWFGYAELTLFLGDEAEYSRARRELLGQFARLPIPRPPNEPDAPAS